MENSHDIYSFYCPDCDGVCIDCAIDDLYDDQQYDCSDLCDICEDDEDGCECCEEL